MLAAWYETNGAAAEVLQVGEVEKPEPQRGEVRVKVHCSGINPSDVKARRRPPAWPKVIPHSDGAGIIDAVGEGVSQSRVGERVWLWNAQWQRAFGTAAEFVALPSEQAVLLSDDVSFEAGACIGIPLLTAWHALSFLGDISGCTLLVTGASSSVGYYVTQIASKVKGAKVIGTVGSQLKADYAKLAGAEHTIDYKNDDVAARLLELTGGKGVDHVIDMDFSTTAPLAATGCIANHATIVSYGSNVVAEVGLPFREFMFRCLSLRQFAIYEITQAQRVDVIRGVSELLANGVLEHSIAKSFSLNDIVSAHEAVEAGNDGQPGNIILSIA